jgi:hypothetical protein
MPNAQLRDQTVLIVSVWCALRIMTVLVMDGTTQEAGHVMELVEDVSLRSIEIIIVREEHVNTQ